MSDTLGGITDAILTSAEVARRNRLRRMKAGNTAIAAVVLPALV